MRLHLHESIEDDPARVLIRHRHRVDRIAAVLARYGLATLADPGDVGTLRAAAAAKLDPSIADLSAAERLRLALAELGPAFVKLGQILSTRVDLVGAEVAAELAKLQADTPPDPPEAVARTIEAELGAPPDQLFSTFEPQALASASIGQVHAAELDDGRAVVVKVIHDGVEATMREDLEILGALTELALRHDQELALYRPRAVVRQITRTLLAELDFQREAGNLRRFQQLFADEPDVVIPGVVAERSARRVLTMERLNGPSLERAAADGDIADPDALARRAAEIFLEMIFRDGVFHADPHPGNILLLDDGHIGILDFGEVGYVDEATRERLEMILLAATERDVREVTTGLLELTSARAALDQDALRLELGDWIHTHVSGPGEHMDVGAALLDLMGVVRRFQLEMPPDVAMLVKTIVQLEGNLRLLGVQEGLMDAVEPFRAELLRARFAPRRLATRALRTGHEWERLAEDLPRELRSLLDGVRASQIDVPITVDGLDRTTNRLVVAILTATIFSGSARMFAAGTPPRSRRLGVSLPGAVGTGLSAVAALRLLRAERRSGGLG